MEMLDKSHLKLIRERFLARFQARFLTRFLTNSHQHLLDFAAKADQPGSSQLFACGQNIQVSCTNESTTRLGKTED